MILWNPITTLPEFSERKVLLKIEYQNPIYYRHPTIVIGWWKHGPRCFAFSNIENANHMVRYWSELNEPEG